MPGSWSDTLACLCQLTFYKDQIIRFCQRKDDNDDTAADGGDRRAADLTCTYGCV